jgi:DNA primase
MGIKYSRAQSRYVFPIFDRYGREAGCISRSYEGDKPKSLTYWWSDTPKLSFIASDRDSTTCCLVEDIVSGIRVSRFLPAVVLLGVGLNEEQVRAIRLRYDSVICALDADATAISIKHKKRHGIMFKNFCVAPLKKDFKDSTDEEILEVLYGTQAIECIPAEQRGVSASTINNK